MPCLRATCWKRTRYKAWITEAIDSYESLIDWQFKMTLVACNVLLNTPLKHDDKIDEANKLFEHTLQG
ncbi:hypothetical protein KSP40_PGU016383 [Platanthera guangdongensis]|uniref:Uncharacterized protein n=1 Tax=Platanthera guangdongensis TaxID=2320717 RepID=A0ABR2MY63_9ASPA